MTQTIQEKLAQYAPEPPQRVWEAIAATLDDTSPALSDKMYHYEVPPPSGLWNSIEQSLHPVSQQQTIPFYQRHKRKIHYSAAAAVLAFIIFTGSLFLSKKTQSDSGVAAIPTPVKTEQPAPRPEETVTVIDQPTENITTVNTLSSATVNNNKFLTAIRKKILSSLHSFAPASVAETTASIFPEKVEARPILSSSAPVDNYMIFSDGNGTAVKLPKKLYDFFACIGKNTSCKERMEQMQEKMARTSVATDFTGVLEILGNMNENQ